MAEIDAGPFGAWFAAMATVLRGGADADVPCGDCVGCCVSGYFIPLRPTDRVALARVPAQHLLAAEGQPPGHAMMGPRDDGTCVFHERSGCRIYAQRPRTCRDYDCRLFAAAGLDAGGPGREVINARIAAWRFRFADDAERATAQALRAAAAFIRDHAGDFPAGAAPRGPTGIAVLAFKAVDLFRAAPAGDAPDVARAILRAARAFDAGGS